MTSLPIYEILTFAIFTLILLGAMLLGMLIIMPLANFIEYKCDEAIEKRKLKKTLEKCDEKHTKNV